MMYMKSLTLEHFRNFSENKIQFCPGSNVIFGDNAQGKTNLLEAISFLSSSKPFRAHNDKELIEFEYNDARVSANLLSGERDYSIDIYLSATARRKLFINGVAYKTAAGFSEIFHTVLFCPEDLYIIKEGAATRRKLMNLFLCQIRPRYAKALSEYNRLCEHKTRILKDCAEKPSLLDTLEDFNLRIAQTGAVLIHYRSRFSERLSAYAALIHSDFSGENERLKIEYKTVKTVLDPFAQQKQIILWLQEHQQSHRRAELETRSCLSGPHKDDLEIYINEKPAKNFASQGQTRTAALSIKLAERELYYNDCGEYPILLLDDVLSELDPKRQEFVLNRITGGQVFITCCEDERLKNLRDGQVFHVNNKMIY